MKTEIRSKKFGGSMKQSEYELLSRLKSELKVSQVDVLIMGLKALEKKVIAKRKKEPNLFNQKE